MRSAIRLAVLLAMASTTAPALAGGTDTSTDERSTELRDTSAAQSEAITTRQSDVESQEPGYGSGEPGRTVARTPAEERDAEKAGIAEYNRERFLQQSWTFP